MDWTTCRLDLKKSQLSGAHFDDKFISFGVASFIMVTDPILRMALFCSISEIILFVIIRC